MELSYTYLLEPRFKFGVLPRFCAYAHLSSTNVCSLQREV